ncbi:phosphoesterase [Streptococcus sp. zg-86]|uniref:Phosphoesterase n=1 Tax=Streptococcus zhangguiae TaxID=2664091 RepID=A0A6I4R984_9STRE|nr:MULTISPECIES: metallophosphoesterase family protein [unclassified Streptococcus]MTB64359.1 phosphoesterase [Streptococcus sp. zg-86]MTB90669.1 phosphoesterase [Streptococcus sp. zg-36]MWV56336.1 phosphoesterase [Streptococcus sp. zg-70]QTH47452.1 metallophosphoesterase family protein [Streptococcus sp. zg-86]
MTNFYIADTHFSDEKCLRYDCRPFQSIEEMNERMIQSWNRTVSPTDTVYILGDVGGRKLAPLKKILPKLRGKKQLIVGNHDGTILAHSFLSKYFESISDYREITDRYKGKDYNIILHHYPSPFIKDHYQGNTIYFYGHVHNSHEEDYTLVARLYHFLNHEDSIRCHKMLNVGCMMPYMGYRPRRLEELMPVMLEQNQALYDYAKDKQNALKEIWQDIHQSLNSQRPFEQAFIAHKNGEICHENPR